MSTELLEPGFAAQLAEDLPPDDLRLVLGVFRTDVVRLCETLGTAARSGDLATFRRVSHGLAGAAGAVGAEKLEQACRLAMTRADMTPPQLPAAHGEIKLLCDAALAETTVFLARLGSA